MWCTFDSGWMVSREAIGALQIGGYYEKTKRTRKDFLKRIKNGK